MLIELLIFFSFLLTMMFLMCKSRFMKVGIDNSGQFEPIYMRILAQKIADSVPTNPEQFNEQYYDNSERLIQVENVSIKILLNKKDFRAIEAKEPVKLEDA